MMWSLTSFFHLEDEMQKAGQAIEGMTEPPEVVGVLAFETDCIIARLAALCPIKENWRIERELRKRVKNRFDQEGIQMPHFHRQPLE
jgi:small conductance mechanosensitive channel